MIKKRKATDEERAFALDEEIRATVTRLDTLYAKRAHRRGTGYIAGWIYCGCGREHMGPISPAEGNATQEERDRMHCRECRDRYVSECYARGEKPETHYGAA
jgi:hypothetical protein